MDLVYSKEIKDIDPGDLIKLFNQFNIFKNT